jgi:MerR family regulatory protein
LRFDFINWSAGYAEVSMRIGDAAAAAGTTPRALRFYEENGLLPPPHRTAAGHRIAALDAEIVRLTQLRNQLAARIVPAPRDELAS